MLCFIEELEVTQDTVELIWTILSLLLFPCTIAYLILANKITNILKQEYPNQYAELGRSTLIQNNSITNSFKFVGFLVKAKYKEIDNPTLSQVADIARSLLILGCLFAIVIFLLPIIVGYI